MAFIASRCVLMLMYAIEIKNDLNTFIFKVFVLIGIKTMQPVQFQKHTFL